MSINKKNKEQKEFKQGRHRDTIIEVKMRLFGRGHGYLGMPKGTNPVFRLIIIWIAFGGLGIYLIKINQFWAGLISFALGIMFSAFNNLLKD